MGKIAIVGVEGSGKTVLMAALSECYQQISDTEPYLMPENQSAFMFQQRIPHKLRVDHQWPEQTRIDSLRTLKWTLRYGVEILEEIEILDYPGELYRIAFGEHTTAEADAVRPELNEFLTHLINADTLVVLLNLADLNDLARNPRNAETVWITRGIFDYAKKNLPNLKHRFLAFTQADRYADELAAAGSAQALYAAKLPMLKVLYPDLSVTAVAAVDGMDASGNPKEGYSVSGCYEFMRDILVERDNAIKESLEKCDLLLRQIKAFDAGGAALFNTLVGSYMAAYEDLRRITKPLNRLYKADVIRHYKKTVLFFDLREVIQKHESTCGTAVLADRSAWAEVLSRFENCEHLIAAFSQFYLKMHEQKKNDDRTARIARIVGASVAVGFVILIIIVSLLSAFNSK